MPCYERRVLFSWPIPFVRQAVVYVSDSLQVIGERVIVTIQLQSGLQRLDFHCSKISVMLLRSEVLVIHGGHKALSPSEIDRFRETGLAAY